MKTGWIHPSIALAVALATVPIQAQDDTETAPDFAAELAERDAIIAQLTARLERLERMLLMQQQNSGAASPARPAPTIPADLERALERTLVQGGTALISAGSIELTPSFSYAFDADRVPLLVSLNDAPEVVSNEQRRSFLEARMGARIGLPWNSQFDISMPYRFAFRDDVLSLAGTPIGKVERDASALGDVTLALSHVISGSDSRIPRVIGRIRGNLGTADREAGEGLLGGGFPGIGAGLSVSQRLDPLVLAGSLSYDNRFSEGGIDPGDRWGYSLATYLAASPETSLRIQFDQQFFQDVRVAGERFAGSGGTSASLSLGASVIASRRMLLDLGVAVGLTENSPDFALTLSAPLEIKR